MRPCSGGPGVRFEHVRLGEPPGDAGARDPVSSETIERSGERARLASWRGDGRVAHLSPAALAPLSADFIGCCVDRLRRRGYTSVVTSALSVTEARGFLQAGFEIREELDLLAHDLREIPPAPGGLRRARKRDRKAVLALDSMAFPDFWQLGVGGLGEALVATPHVRFRLSWRGAAPRSSRLSISSTTIAGYAITGRGAGIGYLQRLAVHPDARGLGLGRALVVDGLGWLRRRGCNRALVNTQQTNDAARALYVACGFRLVPEGLQVLARAL